MTKIIHQLVWIQGCFESPNQLALGSQSPEGLLTNLQHPAIELSGRSKFLIGIGDLFPIQASSTPLDLAPRFTAAGADANGAH
jgi:hypothetical protein